MKTDELDRIQVALRQAQAQAARARRVRDELGKDHSGPLHVVRSTLRRASEAVQEELEELAKGRTLG